MSQKHARSKSDAPAIPLWIIPFHVSTVSLAMKLAVQQFFIIVKNAATSSFAFVQLNASASKP
jgi:hypothetical protein